MSGSRLEATRRGMKALALDVVPGKAPRPRRFLYLLLLALVGCSGEPLLRSAPPTVAGLELHHQLTGERAMGAIQRMHGKADIGITDVWIAQYGEDVSAMLYVSASRNRAAAKTLLTDMRDRIAEGNTPFRGIHDTRIFGADVYVMAGQGQIHFLFTDGKRVVWLSADPPVACTALAEILASDEGAEGCGAVGP